MLDIGHKRMGYITGNELVHHRRYETCPQAIVEITEYSDIFYNRQRRHSRLGNLSPAAFTQQFYRRGCK